MKSSRKKGKGKKASAAIAKEDQLILYKYCITRLAKKIFFQWFLVTKRLQKARVTAAKQFRLSSRFKPWKLYTEKLIHNKQKIFQAEGFHSKALLAKTLYSFASLVKTKRKAELLYSQAFLHRFLRKWQRQFQQSLASHRSLDQLFLILDKKLSLGLFFAFQSPSSRASRMLSAFS